MAQPAVVDGAVEAFWIGMSQQEQQAYEAMLRKQIDRLRVKHDIPPDNVFIASGDPVTQLPRRAKKLGAGLVVMGAVSRRGLQRLFIGHTAERVIDELACDVLIVKPAGFKTPIVRRVR
jgi:nucleotide-binding universal stress UspA family protein